MARSATYRIRRGIRHAALLAAGLLACAVTPALASDPTEPTASFVSWTESSSYAHYNAGNDINRLWFNPNYSGSATARILAQDPDSGIAFVTFPTGPSGWSPAGGNQPIDSGGGNYDWIYSWAAGAAAGTVQATASHTDPIPAPNVQSLPVDIEFVADSTMPDAATTAVDFNNSGWRNTTTETVTFPPATDFSDTGSSATGVGPITRLLQNRVGVPTAFGGCDTSSGTWNTIATNPPGTSYSISITTPGECWEVRYRIEDAVGNARNLYASGFRGYDNVPPSVTVTSITPGTNPFYQKVVGPNDIYFNGNQSGDFTVTAVPTDDASAPFGIRWTGLGASWTSPVSNTWVYDPGPWTQVYSWTAGASNPNGEYIRVQDYAGNWQNVSNAFYLRRDTAAPGGGGLNFWTPNWNTTSVTVDQTGAMTDSGAGVASYQLQREEAPWTGGAGGSCGAWGGIFTNIGPTVYGDPPPLISAFSDTTVADNTCYRYRIEAFDQVGNGPGYLAPTGGSREARVDQTPPTGTLDPLPSPASGNVILGGTIADTMSGTGGSAQATIRIEDQSNLGVFTTIYTDTSVGTGVWGNYTWNTTAYNGTYKVYLDVTDTAGNTTMGAATQTIVIDNTIPTMTFDGFTEGSNPACQYVDPLDDTIAFINTSGSCSGDILARFIPADPDTAIDYITLPAAPTGWTPTGSTTQIAAPGPWELSYAWATGAANFGTRNATATNTAGKNSLNEPFTITRDTGNPGGGAVSYPTGWTTVDPITITITNYTDGGSGIYHQQLLRDEVPRTAANCGGGEAWPGTYSTVVTETIAGDPNQTLPATFDDTTVVTGMCYRYRLVAEDNVSNTSGTSATPTAARTDYVMPTATIDTGSPVSPFRNTVTLTGTADDGLAPPASGAIVDIRWENLDDLTTGTVGTDTTPSPTWARGWNTTTVPDGNYRIHIDVRDNAGNMISDIALRDVVVDNSPPIIDLVSFTEGSQPECEYWDGLPSLTFYYSRTGVGCVGSDFTVDVNASDPPGGLTDVQFPAWTNIYPTSTGSGTVFQDTTPPYSSNYTFTSTVGNAGGANIVAHGASGYNTTLSTRFVHDNSAPTGVTFTGPGDIAAPGYWTNATSVSVPFDVSGATDPTIGADPGSGIRAGSHEIARRETTNVNCSGGWSAWTTISGSGPASPFSDGSVATGTCYQYRVGVYDNTNNEGWFPDTTNQLRVDQVDPTGTLDPVPPNVKGTSIALSGTSADDWSGVASISVRIGAGPATACTPAVAASWSCTWDTTTSPNGPVTLNLELTDAAGNVVDAATASTYVDNELPAGAVTLTEGTNAQWQHVVPGPTPRIWINTDEASGDFTADVSATDGFSGILDVTFPDLLAGWSPAGATVPGPTGPYQVTYAWTGPGANSPGALNAVMQDNALNSSTAPFEVLADTADPTGSSIQYPGGPTSVPAITFSEGADADSGLLTWRIERDETTVNGPGSCDPFPGTWTTVATDPASSPWTDGSVVLGNCYQYRLVVEDNVGNVVTVTDPESDVVTVEPAGIVITESGGTTDVAEGGATDTYDVTLRTIPAGNVTITLATPDGQVATSSPTLTFTPGNWNVPQTVTVTAVDDSIDEVPDPHTGQITHVAASSDPDYDGLAGADVIANVTDNDVAGITVSPDSTSVDVAEAGATTDTYTIVLDSEPVADVTVNLSNVDGQVGVSPGILTFTSANWSTPQTVTVQAIDDPVDEAATHPGVVLHGVASADPLYDGYVLADVTATVTDNDTSNVTVTPTAGLSLDENDVPTTTSYDVVLDTQPLDDVTVTVVGDGQATPDLTSLLFTSANWSTPQTVTMTVVDDAVVEGAHTSTVSHLASSVGDPAYDGIAVAPVVIDIADNDVPGIEVTSTGPMSVAEAGTTDSYDIRLESQPTADVQIAFTTDAQLDPITTLTFTSANWNSYQTVTVSAVDDFIDETDPHSSTIVHGVTSADPNYDGWVLADMGVDIADNDTAGVTIDELGGVAVDEANVAATDTFTVVLDSQPTADITITMTPDAQVNVLPSNVLTFTTANWSTPQTVTVEAVDDPIDEADPHPGTITFLAGGDPLYDLVVPSPVVANVADDDTAGITMSPGTLALDETLPASDTYTIVLDTQPAADVTVTVAPDAQVATTDTTLTFTTVNWATPQTVTVEAVDDPMVETTPHPGQLTHTVTSADPAYDGFALAAKDADITDNDTPGLTLTESGGSTDVAEGGATDTYDIVLDAQPGTGQTVTVTISPDAQVTTDVPTLVFDDTNWNTPQTVTVTAVDDPIQEADPHPGLVTHTVASSDPLWSSVTTAPDVNVTVADNDVADVIITSASPYSLSEDTPAATVSYDVRLATQPTSDVTVDLTVPGDINADVISLTFTSANWSVDQTVTVNAIDDLVTETPIHTRTITHAVTTGDPFYSAVTVGDVQFDVTDNDIPGITVDKTSLATTEGGASDTFSVVLETMPASPVTVTLTGTQVGFDVNPLVFDNTNWSTPQVVTVDAIDDAIDEGSPHAGNVALAVTSPDAVYDAWPLSDIPVDITDNDTAGVTVAPGSGTPLSVAETGPTSDTYSIVLDSEPTANVDVAIATADGQTTADKATVTFTPLDWMTPQVVTVTAVDDGFDETDPHPGLVTHAATSGDPRYDGITVDDQTVDIADDDTADVVVTPTSGLTLDEAASGVTTSFDVVLASQPVVPVTISLATSDGQTTVGAPTLTFDGSNWSTPQTVTVTVVDDMIDEAATHPGVVEVGVVSGGDPAYDAIDPSDVTVDIADDDTAGVTVTESAGSTDVDEAGTTDTYDVVLDTEPTADVTITITGGPQASTDVTTLTFTPTDWNTPQVVTVTGTPDALVEGPHTQLFTHAAASADPNYDGAAVTIADVTANITDDDIAGATITPTSIAISEDGTTATYDVVLDAQPTADVTITMGTADGQTTTDVPSLVFTSGNWSTPQTVTVTAVDDLVTEPTPHTGVITHAMTSTDPDFDGVPVSDVTADITDNDIPGVTVTPTNISVTEGGAGASFDVVLDSVPGADVDVTFTEPGQLDPIATVTFTPANWNTPQTISVNAFDDFIMEGAHTTQITIDTASAAPAYDTGALTITPVDVDITDNDTAGVLLVPSSGLSGAEGGPNVTYDMSLTSEPTDTIEITLAGDADGAPVSTTYTFDNTNWATPQTVDVAIVDDLIDEGPHTTTITGSITSAGADAFYGAVAVADQSIAITDNDTAGVTFTPALPGPLAIAEGGATGTYDVVLDTEPTGDVTIDIVALAGQATADVPTLTFTPASWMTPQTVTITAVDDAIAETDPHFDSMTHVAGGADPVYAALVLGDMDLTIADNDVPGVRIDATAPDTSVAEGGAGDTVEVVLESEPVASVDVTLTPDSQVVLGTTTLTFDDTNWNTPQTVTVDAFDDAIVEGAHTGTIDAATSSVGDPNYAGVTATQHVVNITDNDIAGVVITQPAATDLDESNTAAGQTYQVRLQSEPVANVDVAINPDGQLDTGGVTVLTFTPADWSIDQSVTVYPIDDAVSEADPHPGVVSHDTNSTDPNYATGTLTIDTVTFDIADNDTPGIQITPTSGHNVEEGGATSTYDIVLLSQPTDDVVFTPVSTQLEWSVPSITFTAANWNTPQTVTLQAIDDQVDEPDPHPGTLSMSIASTDTGYTSLTPADVDASIIDNDTSDLVVTPATGLTVDEAGLMPAATYTLTLTSIPSAPVDVTITPDAQVAASVPTVTLDNTNWNTGVTVDVTAIDDQVDEADPHPGTLTHVMASADPNFDGETGPDEVVDVVDDDTAGVTITPTGPDTTVAEDGSSPDSYDVVLDTQPTADVTITVTPDAQVSAATTTLTFTSTDWNTPQTVNVDAVDDAIIEGPHTGTFTHSAASADPNYDGITIADEVANVLDDDVAGVVVTPAGGTFEIAEGGTGDTLNIQLTSEPLAPVTINLTADAQATLGAPSVTLDNTNWNTGVDVTVDAVDDGFIEASPHPAVISFAIDPGSDPDYLGVTIPDATADVADNDAASVTVDVLDGINLDEANVASTDTFEVHLDASPAVGQTVDVNVATDAAQLTAAPTVLTFDDTNWNTPQVVTLTVVDDAIDEADPHTSAISFTTSSTDTNFDALTVADVDATIADDDTADLVLDTTSIAIDETGPTGAVVNVHLASEPIGTVEVAIASDAAQVTTSPAGPLTFDNTNWNIDQPVTITAVDDAIDETDPHQSTITFSTSSVASADSNYDAVTPVDVTADITDNDTSDVLITPNAGTETDEANPATTMTWDVVLATQPTGDVTVDLLPDAQLEVVGATTLTFTSGDWSTPQTIEVRAHDDQVDEADPHPGLLAFAMGGLDPIYAGLAPAALTPDVRDDDTAGVTVTQLPAAPQALAEDGSLPAATYDVVLDTQPAADVDVTVTADAQVDTGGITTLTFTPANWSTPQTVTVTAVDDAVTEPSPHPGVVTHDTASLDPNYDTGMVTVADATFDITDDDVPGFHFDPVAPTPAVDEADVATTASYDLYIDTVPASPVTVNFAATSGQVTISPSSYTFDNTNFATPVTITVTAIDDPFVEGPHTDTITHLVDPGSDPSYVPVTIPDVTASVADDDTAALVVDDLGGVTLDEADAATTDTFTVALAASPNVGETVDVAIGTADGQTTVDLPTLTFDDTNWNVPQTVTVTVVDDPVTEPTPHPGTITFTTTSAQPDFDALVTPDLVADIADDDVPDFVITDFPSFTMDEADVAGTERTMSIALATAPPTPVTVNITADAQLGLQSLPSLTFDNTNWNTPQDVVVRAIDDLVAEADPHPGVLTFAVDPGSDPLYTPLTIADRTFDISDDDLANVAVDCTPGADWNVNVGGNVDLSEVPADATHDVVCSIGLGTIAAQDVTIDITTDPAQVTVDVPSVVIPAGTNGPVDVTFTAVDDAIDETDPHQSVATFAVSSPDPIYDAETMPDVTFDIVDDDTAGITVTQLPAAPQALAEDGSLPAATYDVVLTSEPTADVTITLTPDGQVDTGGTTVLTFTSANWSSPQTVTVNAVDDAITEASPHTGTITHTAASADPSYDGATVTDATFDITDDDVPGFHLNPVAPTPAVDEADVATTATYELYIDTAPINPVTVNFATTTGDVSISPATWTFDGSNYLTPAVITVTAIDDQFVEGPHADTITHVVDPGSDAAYLGVTIPDVTASVADDDTAALVVDDLGGVTLDEADAATTDTFTVALAASPNVGETVDVAIGTADGQTTVDLPTLTFDDTNWNVPQTVTVTVVDDPVVEADPHTGAITFSTTSAQPEFDGLTAPDVVASIADNDTPGWVVTPPAATTLDEADPTGSAQTFTVALATPPAPGNSVILDLLPDAQVELDPTTPGPLVFDDTTWSTPQTVIVRAIDDPTVEATPHTGVLSFDSAASTEPAYASLPLTPMSFDVTDDDTPGITFTPATPGPLAVDEAGTTATYDVVLDRQPLTDVTVDIASPDSQATVDVPTLTFTNATWSIPQTVTVTAVDDAIAEGSPHAGTLTHTVGGDPAWTALTPGDMNLDITDNDTAGVTVTQTPSPQDLDEAGTLPAATYTVQLTSEPTADVTFAATVDTQVLASPSTLTFTNADWNTPQTITVTAVDDAISEGAHTGTITHDTSSTDPNYDTGVLTIPDATFNIADDDIPGFTVTPIAPVAGLDEADVATTVTYDVSIDTDPTAAVDVALAPVGANATVSPATLTFNPGDAGIPQTVTVTVVDDALVEGPHSEDVASTVTSGDATYDGFVIAPVNVPIADDDAAGVTVDLGGGVDVAELGQTTDTFTVVLDAQPTADVTVDIAFDSMQLVAPSPSTLTFTNADWNVPQTVTVQPLDDSVTEPDPHTSTLSFTTTSADAAFDGLTVPDADVSIADDDAPALDIVDPADLTMDEADPAGSERIITVQLHTQPVGTVTVMAANPGSQVAFQASPMLTFTPLDWNVPQQVVVRPVQDGLPEASPHTGDVSLSVTAAPSDPGYASLAGSTTTFQITDMDAANVAIDCQSGVDWTINGSGNLDMSENPADANHDVTCDMMMGTAASADVVVDVTTTPGLALGASPASVTILAGDTGPATITFTATDDAIAQGPHTATIDFAVSTTDTFYGGLTIPSVNVDIADDDVSGVTVTPAGPLAVAEGGASATFDVVLQSQPSADVTVDLLPDSQVATNLPSLTFTPTNWNVAQTVTVSAVDDGMDEPDPHPGIVAFGFSSTDPTYGAATAAPVNVDITDNDTPGVVVTPTDTGNAVTEGGANDSFDVMLGSQPTATVTITLDGGTQVGVAPATLTFTPADWNLPQTVTLSAVQDAIVEGDHQGNVTFSLDSTDIAYMNGSAATPGAQAVSITDDDAAGITIVQSDGDTKLAEGGATDTYTVALKAQPTADVTITIDGTPQVTTSPETLTFTPTDWAAAQTVTVTAVQDSIDEADPHPGEIRHAASTTAAGWTDVKLEGVTASIADDDEAGIIVEQSDGSTDVTEGEAQGDVVTIRLASQPTKDVSILPSGDAQIEVSDTPIVLGPDSWRDPVTLAVKAVDDQEVEGDHEGLLGFKVSTEDESYGKQTISAIIVKITDNDEDGGTDDGTGDGTDETTTRNPRSSVPPATTRPGASTNKSGSNRTKEGSKRTNEGRTRLPSATDATSTGEDQGVRTGQRLGGEVVAAKKQEKAKRKGPVAAAANWLGDHWKLWVPLLALGMIAAGTGAYMLRSDPARAAQKAAGKGGDAARMAGKGGRNTHTPHRLRAGRKKDDDDEEEAGAAKGKGKRPKGKGPKGKGPKGKGPKGKGPKGKGPKRR